MTQSNAKLEIQKKRRFKNARRRNVSRTLRPSQNSAAPIASVHSASHDRDQANIYTTACVAYVNSKGMDAHGLFLGGRHSRHSEGDVTRYEIIIYLVLCMNEMARSICIVLMWVSCLICYGIASFCVCVMLTMWICWTDTMQHQPARHTTKSRSVSYNIWSTVTIRYETPHTSYWPGLFVKHTLVQLMGGSRENHASTVEHA